MNRVYWIYLSLLLVMLAVMLTVTQKLRTQERLDQLQSLAAENERLALWRIESQLLPLVIRESSRVYDDTLFASNSQRELPSDLIGCFRVDRNSKPVVVQWTQAPAAVPEQTGGVTVDWASQVQRDCVASSLLAAIDSSAENGTAVAVQQIQLPLAAEKGQSEAPNDAYLSNSIQQSARSEQEFLSRSRYQSANADLVNQLQMQVFDRADQERLEPMSAAWVDERLYLVRRRLPPFQAGIEGCLVNWKSLRQSLLAEVSDLLPEASLVPLVTGSSASLSLANLPLQLIPGSPDLTGLPVTSTLGPTLLIAWSCFLASAVALGLLLIGVVRLSERRAAFVSAVTHELRTPLTTLRLYADLLSQPKPLSDEKHRRYVDTLRRESNRLHYLIENVLGWSRLERSVAAEIKEVVEWEPLWQRLQPSLLDRISQSESTLCYEPAAAPTPFRFLGNPTAVERVLFNLIDNACKYSHAVADRRIHLRVHTHDRFLVWEVADHGPGIDAAVIPRLFKPFSKSAEDAARTAPGIGLGLSLSRRLARDMGGELQLQQATATGTTFALRLPLA